MTAIITGVLAIALYLSGAILHYFSLKGRLNYSRNPLLLLGTLAIICHTLSFLGTVYTPQGLDLGLFRMLSLIGWLMAVLITISGLRKPLHNLLLCVYPLAALGLLVALAAPASATANHIPLDWTPHIISHVLLSIFAFSVLTIAALQASLVAVQDHHLRHHQTNGLIMGLPALQIMEQLLFELVWVGVLLLSASILTGIFFIEDLFAQHLAHKTILSITAWVIFSALLAGRYLLGWRGTTAIRWTATGYVLLMLAYFGSKLVLEVILAQPAMAA